MNPTSGSVGEPLLTIVVGHLPPPVHGMAVAVERFAELLDNNARRAGGRCVRLTTVVATRRGSMTYHLGRVRRVLAAARHLWSCRSQRPAVYASCDAGLGMIYTFALLSWSRALGLSCWLHHHSYAYLEAPSRLFRALLLVGGTKTTHLVGCADMAGALRAVSKRPLRITELPILYAVELPTTPPTPHRRTGPIVLGHLSNLSEEKGLTDVFATLERLQHGPVEAELILAGPPATPKDGELVEDLLRLAGAKVRYLGPVYGVDRETFFDTIDVFLFPSRNESFGLVAGESLVRGVEIVAYECGCLTSELVGASGLLLPRNGPFAEPAAAWIESRRPRGGQRRVATIREKRRAAEVVANAVAAEIVTGHKPRPARFFASRRAEGQRQVDCE